MVAETPSKGIAEKEQRSRAQHNTAQKRRTAQRRLPLSLLVFPLVFAPALRNRAQQGKEQQEEESGRHFRVLWQIRERLTVPRAQVKREGIEQARAS
jgi:hypothetical protein